MNIPNINHKITFKKLNLWLTDPKETTPVNWTSETGWQMVVRRDNVISITLCQIYQCRLPNQIGYLSIKLLHNCPREAGWTSFQT